MSPVSAARMALVLLMLCSGLSLPTFATQRLRLFGVFPNKDTESSTMSAASQTCKNKDSSLVTVYDEDDAKFLYKFTGEAPFWILNSIWLGLQHVGNYNWSNGDPVIFTKTSVNLQEGEQKCEAIIDNEWESFNCSEKKFFMCSKGNTYTFHRVKKSWCQALQHCRNYHSNLVSINSSEQNDEVIKEGGGSSFWIGLRHDEWEWDDNGCSSFREWDELHDHGINLLCTTIGEGGTLHGRQLLASGCTDYKKPFCVAGHVRIKVINENKTWEQALDYCYKHHSRLLWIKDEKDQEAVDQWLTHTDTRGPFWIGLRQSRVFGFWIWTDSMVVYENWRGGKEPEVSMDPLCGVIGTEGGKWREKNCLEKRPFLCEEEIIYM